MNIQEIIQSPRVRWMEQQAGSESIVISSRVRLARNLAAIAFPNRFDGEQARQSMEEICAAGAAMQGQYTVEAVAFDAISPLQRQILVEKQLVSPEHAQNGSPVHGVMLNADASLSIMVNEEDHLRIQALLPGLQLSGCWEQADAADDLLEQRLEYAYDGKWGYLTACPTNMGTGMRASVMMHLPALQMSGQSRGVFQRLSQLGLAVRGIYGEGSEASGNFFQISNQVTMGQSEKDLCEYLTGVVLQVAEQELLQRQQLRQKSARELEDKVGRAFGLLRYARLMTSQEALALLSDLRLGVDMDVIKGLGPADITELMVCIRPAHLQQYSGLEMQPHERDVRRAELIQEKLRGTEHA
ncbi:MAG: protein arginine kinase [Syntrophomonadaceae bacterium]|nr:protein arginine kinase [Syntrophomonadaceae bacterium]